MTGGAGRALSLAPLSLPHLAPGEFIACAAAAGFRRVGLRGIAGDPRHHPTDMPALIRSKADLPDLRARLDGEGVQVTEWEFVVLTPDLVVSDCRARLEMGAGLGARWLVVGCDDPDLGRSAEALAALSPLAADHGMGVALEFVPYNALRSLGDAAALMRMSQADVHLLVDAYHFDRSGGAMADIAALPADRFACAQLCDAPARRPATIEAMRQEAREARLVPGEGTLDLAGLLVALPPGLPISIETPNLARARQIGDIGYAKALREATERLTAGVA